ncbi:hypothetical protein LZT04_22700 [Vibrio fluvialis]|nr:hypothetical protein [Vibrio fluvialis]
MALDSFEGQGFVHVDGERWEALSDVPLRKGDLIRVIAVDGLTLQVIKK